MSEASLKLWPGWAFPESALQELRRQLVRRIPRGIGPVIQAGWSLGGLRALREVQQGESPATHLILLSSTARFCADDADWPGLPQANLKALQRQLARDPEQALAGFHRLCAGPHASEELIRRRTNDSLAMDRAELADGLQALAEWDVRAGLAACRIPVLMLHGMKDEVIPVEAAEQMLEQLPLAKLARHMEAGHDLPLADPQWVGEQVESFLNTPS